MNKEAEFGPGKLGGWGVTVPQEGDGVARVGSIWKPPGLRELKAT